MANLTSMPREIINHILIQENIDMEDVVNLGSTCKQLYTVINKDYLWRRKLFQRWPSLKKIHADHLNNDENIKEIVKEGMKYDKELSYCLSILPYIYNAKDTNETFRKNIKSLGWNSGSVKHENIYSLKYYYFHDKLIKLMEADPLDKHINLTNMYYAKKYIVLMKQIDLQDQWRFLSDYYQQALPEQQEQVATLVAQWCQPYKLVFYSVAASLDIVIQQILKVLKDVHPAHSIFAISAEQFSFWKNNNIKDNYWKPKESRQIIDIISRVIFRELNFIIYCVNTGETYVDPKIFFIDQVLESKNASPILLQIIIQSIARRLGVRCDLLHFTPDLLLCWRESYKNESDYYYIDLLLDGSLVNEKDCLRYRPHEFDTHMSHMKHLTRTELVLRLTTNLDVVFSRYTDKYLTQSCLLYELRDMVRSDQIARINWSSNFGSLDSIPLVPLYKNPRRRRRYLRESMIKESDLRRIIDIHRNCIFKENISKKKQERNNSMDLLSIVSEYHRRKIQPRLTRKHLKYTIGMLVEIESPFKSAGVITGWTSKCHHAVTSNCHHYLSWPRFDHVSEPTICTYSYTILACDDRELNVSQEFIKPLKMQKWINNSEIGEYFSHFEGTHYVPNQKLQMLYPMDVNILERKYSKGILKGILKKLKRICFFKDLNVS